MSSSDLSVTAKPHFYCTTERLCFLLPGWCWRLIEQELLQLVLCTPVQGHWKLSSSSCSSVNIELSTINILLNAVWHFIIPQPVKTWVEGIWKQKWWTDFCFLFFSFLIWGQVFILIIRLLCAVGQTWFTNGKICHSVIVFKRRSKVWDIHLWCGCVTVCLATV